MTEPVGRRHVPACDLNRMDICAFQDSLALAEQPQTDYDVSRWLFVPPAYTEYRYLLGTRGRNPLICIGINPSTARPDHLDPTLQSVERIALNNGFDSFMMMNLCAQRATDPNDMAAQYPDILREGNAEAFAYALGLSEKPVVWAAWGTMIEKRPYLAELLRDFVRIAAEYRASWVTYGARSKKGHPHHPLYLRQDAGCEPFDAERYLMVL